VKHIPTLAGLAAALMLAGCSAPASSIKRIYGAYQQINLAKREYPVSRAQIDAQPHAVLGAQVKDGLKGLLVLREQNQGQDLWRADNNVLLATRNGRIVRSVGFAQDLRAIRVVAEADPLGKPMDKLRSYHFAQQLDLAPDRYGLQTRNHLKFVATETLSLHQKPITLDHWQETVELPDLRQVWRQHFWVDPSSGEVWRSQQQLSDDTQVTLEVLKAAPLQSP
jgi:hypothetical protein